jgi:tetratricopeptide (TPR) repeat protein
MWPILLAAFFLVQTPDYSAEGLKAIDAGNYQAAADAFAKAVAADPKDFTAHFYLAQAFGFLHRNAEGVEEYRKTLELKPGLYEAQLNAGILLMRMNEPAGALPLLAQAAEQKPEEYLPRYSLAVAQYQTGALEDAEASYRKALDLDPKSAAAEAGLAHALLRQNKVDDAAPHFQKAAELDPQYKPGLLELADVYEKNHQTSEAAAIYRQFPDNPAIQERLGQMMLETRQYADALPRLEAAYAKEQNEANRVPLATAYIFTGQLEKALALLPAAVQAEPGNYDIRMLYARALRDRRQFSAAAAQFLEAAKLRPADPKPWTETGDMLYMTGALPQALAAFDHARQLGENTPGIWFFRAIILDKLRQLKPALEAYRQFLSMSQGKLPDQEFQARQRARIIERQLERR